jgi:hypothetical protein
MRPGSALLVVAVLALGTIALADALRDGPHQAAGEPEAAVGRIIFPPIIRGTLLYADESCVIRAVSLPTRASTDAPRWRGCGFTVSPDGEEAARPATDWAPNEETVATEQGGSVVVASAGTNGFSFAGSGPAFRPDGLFSYVRHGEVLLVDVDCARLHGLGKGRCTAVALTRADVRRAALRHPNLPSREYLLSASAKELAWLDSTRAAAILSLRIRFVGDYELVAVFKGRSVARAIPFFGERLSRLQASPFGSYFGVRSHAGRVHLFDRDGARLTVPDLTEQRAFAFSPDERWTAIATRASVYVFRTGSENPRVHRIGISARDLAWRPL